jgi:hypothetical protein
MSASQDNKDAPDRFGPGDATAVAIEIVRGREEFRSTLFHLTATRMTGRHSVAEAILEDASRY